MRIGCVDPDTTISDLLQPSANNEKNPSAENLPLAAVNQGIVEEIALLFGL